MDLVSMLQQALLQSANQKPQRLGFSHPACDPGTSNYIRYVHHLLLDDSENDEETEMAKLNNGSSCKLLVEELRSLVAATPDQYVHLKLSNIDFRSLLVEGARAVAAQEAAKAHNIVNTIQDLTKNTWESPSEMVAYSFANGLIAKLVGTGERSFEILRRVATPTGSSPSKVPNQRFHGATATSYRFACEMILHRCGSARRLHVIDFGIDGGYQWQSVMKALANRPAGPPEHIRITGIDFPRLPNQAAVKFMLEECARLLGLSFTYHAVCSDSWERARLPPLNPDEALVVNCNLRMRHAANSKLLLERIFRLQPNMFLQCELSADLTNPFFVPRFQEALWFFEACFSATNEWRNLQELLQRQVMDVVTGCKGQKLLRYTTWDFKARKAGLEAIFVPEEILDRVSACAAHFSNCRVTRCESTGWLLLSRNHVMLSGICAWQPTSSCRIMDPQMPLHGIYK